MSNPSQELLNVLGNNKDNLKIVKFLVNSAQNESAQSQQHVIKTPMSAATDVKVNRSSNGLNITPSS